jgi:MFS family permease
LVTDGAPSGVAGPAPSERREAFAQYTGALFFSVSLGITLVAYPLFVVGTGRSKTLAGVLIGLSAAVQVLTRWQLGSLMRAVSNANVISAAAVLKCLAVGLLVLSPSMTALVASAALQGVARACFWTGNQVQIIRSPRPTPKAIATLNMTATVGMLIGPALGGFIAERSFEAAFAVASAVALVSIAPTLMLRRLPPFARVGGHGYLQLLRNRGVQVGVWASIAVGAWRGLLGSYVPIGLDAAGSSEFVIGVVVAVANGAAAIGGYMAVPMVGQRVAPGVARWGAVTLVATAFVGFELSVALMTAALVAGGVAIGLIQVLAITAVSETVQPELTGDAVTLVGVARGLTLSGAPLGVAALLVLGLGPAVLVVTAALVAPAVVFSDRRAWRLRR